MTALDVINTVFALLIWFQVKHFLADYPLQGQYMLGKFKEGWDFLLPLLAHVGVHGAMTLGICLWLRPEMWWLALVDMAIHFTMDRIKAGPKWLGRFKPLTGPDFNKYLDTYEHAEDADARSNARQHLKGNVLFWWSLGLDQMVHHLTHYGVIYALLVW